MNFPSIESTERSHERARTQPNRQMPDANTALLNALFRGPRDSSTPQHTPRIDHPQDLELLCSYRHELQDKLAGLATILQSSHSAHSGYHFDPATSFTAVSAAWDEYIVTAIRDADAAARIDEILVSRQQHPVRQFSTGTTTSSDSSLTIPPQHLEQQSSGELSQASLQASTNHCYLFRVTDRLPHILSTCFSVARQYRKRARVSPSNSHALAEFEDSHMSSASNV